MPPRPTILPRSIALPNKPCLHQTRAFRPSARCQSDSLPNHYETLQLSPTASAAEVKRQFYTLSKKYHPDRNRDDPTASTRFVAISEAYHVLAVPEKRAQYDAQIQQSKSSRWGAGAHPQGSYSSASFGGRPASGLNKKRSTFRGPPPSFYKTGGYGAYGAKRAEHAYNPNSGGTTSEEAPRESYGDFGGGFGPGQTTQGREVPHFDDRRHRETQESVNEHISARRRRGKRHINIEEEMERGKTLIHFLVVSGTIGIIGLTVKIFGDMA